MSNPDRIDEDLRDSSANESQGMTTSGGGETPAEAGAEIAREGGGLGGAPKPHPRLGGRSTRDERRAAILTARALRCGWVTPERIQEHVGILDSIASDREADTRARVSASLGVLSESRGMLELEQRMLEHDDKAERLDAGEATENQGVIINVVRPSE